MAVAQTQKASKRLLLIALLVVFFSSFIASQIQTSGGQVDVRDIKFRPVPPGVTNRPHQPGYPIRRVHRPTRPTLN